MMTRGVTESHDSDGLGQFPHASGTARSRRGDQLVMSGWVAHAIILLMSLRERIVRVIKNNKVLDFYNPSMYNVYVRWS